MDLITTRFSNHTGTMDLITTRFSNLDDSLLNSIRLDMVQNTECYYVKECKIIDYKLDTPCEALCDALMLCPVVEVAAQATEYAEVVNKSVYVCNLKCNNTDGTHPMKVYTSMVHMDSAIRFVSNSILLCILMPGQHINIDMVVCVGTQAKNGPACDPTCVVAIRSFDRPWILVDNITGTESAHVMEGRLLETKLTVPMYGKHTATYTNTTEANVRLTSTMLIDFAYDTYLGTLKAGASVTVVYSVLEPTNNVLIVETTGVYTPTQLINSALRRVTQNLLQLK